MDKKAIRGSIIFEDELLTGKLAESNEELKGALLNPEKIYGKSAYEIAVKHGFEGTEEEWLESLKGDVIMLEQLKATLRELISEHNTNAAAHDGVLSKVEALANRITAIEQIPFAEKVGF